MSGSVRGVEKHTGCKTRRCALPLLYALAGVFLWSFVRVNEVNLADLLSTNWAWGVLAGTLVSIFLVKTVRSQPVSRRVQGSALVFDLTWAGLVYGVVDALFLNIMPVIAVWIGFSGFDWAETLTGKIVVGTAGLFASLLVTLTYHLGYPEFRNRSVALVLVGNSIITLAFILSGSAWGSIISHAAMHIAAVMQGAETTIQLPPHYQKKIEAQ